MPVGSNFRDGFLVQGQPLGRTSTTILLTADNTVVNIVPYAAINLESDNTTATNRTFTLLGGQIPYQDVVITFTSGSSTTADLQNSGNVVLSAAWQPQLGDNITLEWNTRLSKWVEIARVDAA